MKQSEKQIVRRNYHDEVFQDAKFILDHNLHRRGIKRLYQKAIYFIRNILMIEWYYHLKNKLTFSGSVQIGIEIVTELFCPIFILL